MRKDKIILNPAFPIDIYRNRNIPFSRKDLHLHDVLELNLVLSGSGENIIGDTCYNMHKGDIFVINNLEYHHAFTSDTLELLIIVFDENFLFFEDSNFTKVFFEKPKTYSHLIKANTPSSDEIEKILLKAEKEFSSDKPFKNLFIKAYIYEVLAIMNRHFVNVESSSPPSFNNALSYIKVNFKNKITLDEVATHAHMNSSYLSSCFKKRVGCNFQTYLRNTRLHYANHLLTHTNLSIMDILTYSGFTNHSHFTKCFKELFDITPKEIRQKNIDDYHS